MAWTSMHFAVGMTGGAVIGSLACLITGRGWRWLTAGMTAGGAWAILPDLPRFFREDFPSLPLASILGAKALERELHQIGDLFFFHARLDAQPHELALHGFALIILLYCAGWGAALVGHPSRWRRHHVSRSRGAGHRSHRGRHARYHRRSRHSFAPDPPTPGWDAPPTLAEGYGDPRQPLPARSTPEGHIGGGTIAQAVAPDDPDAPAIAGRIRSSHLGLGSENPSHPRAAAPTGESSQVLSPPFNRIPVRE